MKSFRIPLDASSTREVPLSDGSAFKCHVTGNGKQLTEYLGNFIGTNPEITLIPTTKHLQLQSYVVNKNPSGGSAATSQNRALYTQVFFFSLVVCKRYLDIDCYFCRCNCHVLCSVNIKFAECHPMINHLN